MSEIKLVRASLADAETIWQMQKAAFMEMLEKYKDYETSPANEPLEKTVKRLSSPSTYFYFIFVDGWNKRISPMVFYEKI